MSGIFDQIINYSPPLIVSGTVNYKGTWNASTNNPTLNSSPAASTKGDYYVVSTAGTQFGITFAIGDWIISNGTAWEKVDLTDAVSSVFGRTGAVVGVSTDYSAVGLTNTAIGASNPSTGAFTTVSASTPIAVASGGTGVSTSTGTTNVVLSNSPTIVTPVIAQINDASGNETLKLASIASAVNEISIENAATGNPVHIRATGGDASVGLHLVAKGASGYVNVTDGVDETKRLMFNASGGTTNTRTMLSSTQTVDRTLTLPDATGTLLYGGGPLGTPSSGTVTNLTGTASININGTVGATTPSTGAFTTLSASGTITKNNTAATNSLAFFSSGSTTGAVYTNLGNTGNNIYAGVETSAGNTFVIGSTAYDAFITDVNGVGLTVGVGQNKIGRFSSTGLAVTGALSSTTGATFATSSGSVGIGTATPVSKLDVVETATIKRVTSGNNMDLNFYNGSGAGTAGNVSRIRSDGDGISNDYGALSFWTGRIATAAITERMRIDSSGNVGIGTTSPAANLDVRGANKLFDSHGIVNVYATDSTTVGYGGSIAFGGNNGTGGTSPYPYAKIQGVKEGSTSTWNGALVFGTTASSSAVTERMRIDSSGNLLVGTTSASNMGVNTKFVVRTDAPAALGAVYQNGTGAVDTGISINQFNQGAALLLLASRNTDTGLNTAAAVYFIRFYYDGNNAPSTTYIGGSSDFITFGVSGSNTLTITNSGGGNANYSWFTNK